MPEIANAASRLRTSVAAGMLAALVGPATGHAQILPVGDAWEEYLRVMQVAGLAAGSSFTVRPVGRATLLETLQAGHPWGARVTAPTPLSLGSSASLTVEDPGARVFANSAFADGGSDGPVWQGKGLTAAVDVGATLRVGPLTATVHPLLWYAANGDFELAPGTVEGMPAYGYPWRRIDLPQRPGPDGVGRLDPGDSSVRLELGSLSVGVGTESLWWGPGIRNAILVSDNAGGFPHAFVRTERPARTGIGTLEAQWIFGRLAQSAWFDTTFADRGRYVTGAVLAFTPAGLEELTVGAARLFYALVPHDGIGADDVLLLFQRVSKSDFTAPGNPSGEDEADQMFSAFARWLLPESGFEAWVEWARNDHGWNLRDYFLAPEQAQGYTLGFRKVKALPGANFLSVQAELTHLERSATVRIRDVPTYYEHYAVPPGYTHRGQIVGASVGPGGNSQFLGASLFGSWGRGEVFVARRVHDNDAYYDLVAPDSGWCCHDVSLDIGAGGLFWSGPVEMGVRGTLTREYNRHFIRRNDPWNVNVQVSARYRPR